jgi:type II secretory pathway component GspD/PulD (secretin)
LGDQKELGVSYLQHPGRVGSVTGVGGVNNLSDANKSFFGGTSTTTSTDTNNPVAAVTQAFGKNVGGLPGGFSYMANFNNDLDVVLTAVAGDSRVNVLSRPRIQTSHNQEADLFVGDTVPYVTGTYFSGGYGGGPSSQYQQREVGISLSVLPLINPDGLVVMQIQQNVEQLGKPVPIPGAGDVPSTTKRNATSTVAVRDRETIILGGFISNTKSQAHSGVPYLKDIPVLGALFRSSSKKNDRVELIVLIRPTVLPTPKDAALMAQFERNKMSGVKQAEIDLREDERVRWAAIEAQLKKDAAEKKKKGIATTNAEPVEPFPPVSPENPLIPAEPLRFTPPATTRPIAPDSAAPVTPAPGKP